MNKKRTVLGVLFGSLISAVSMAFVSKSYYELGKVQGRIDAWAEQSKNLEKINARLENVLKKATEIYENLE